MDNYWIAIGQSRFDTKWVNKQFKWCDFCERLRTTTRTRESQEDYFTYSKDRQDNIKDVGGFVCGVLTDGRRSTSTVKLRSMLTLDVDYAPIGLWDEMLMTLPYKAVMYTTHKHRPEAPRFRIILPLTRNVSPEEYEAVGRMIAHDIGIDYFDDTTYQASRLMYWPSTSIDAEYLMDEVDEDVLDPQEILDRYPDWKDITTWPTSSRVSEVSAKRAEKQQNPREKSGIVGAFCRAYDIHDAIAEFLPDVYSRCDTSDDRYTYLGGSTAGGLVIYGDGDFAYSNHSTDPTSGMLCNAFDLVRIHRFGDMDTRVKEGTSITKYPSYKAMVDLASADKTVSEVITSERVQAAKSAFADDAEEDMAGAQLATDKKGVPYNTIENIIIAIKSDDAFKGVRYNSMSQAIEVSRKLPWGKSHGEWTDQDDAQLRAYLEKVSPKFTKEKVYDALTKVTSDRAYHPVQDYLNGLPEWDGEPRVETLLIDYLGAENTEYTRAVTRVMLCAAVRRAYKPGCKYDQMVVLNGAQGVGKSTFVAKLGGKWFSDSLKLSDTKDKTAAEKLQGFWIMEIGELAGMRKTDKDVLKAFISSQRDDYRAAYGRRRQSRLRSCIFIGTVNGEEGYLQDTTGNRRFWDVQVTGNGKHSPWDMTEDLVAQIWAEAILLEPLTDFRLSSDLEREAVKRQKEALESDPRQGLVEDYLDTLLPDDWYDKSIRARRDWYMADVNGRDTTHGTPKMKRIAVSTVEVCYECFGIEPSRIKRADSIAAALIMNKLEGWEKGKRRQMRGYGRVRTYQRLGCDEYEIPAPRYDVFDDEEGED